MRHIEDILQMHSVRWFDYKYPQYSKLLHHSPNGGFRNTKEAARFKANGTRAGFPDLILLVARHGYNCLCIEMKSPTGKQTTLQREWQLEAEKQGNKYVIIRDVESFIKTINEYLK